MASVQEFSARIKEKYPQYKNVDDLELAKRIVEKHPQYASRVTFESAPIPEQASFYETTVKPVLGVAGKGLEAIGTGLTAVSTGPIRGAAEAIQDLPEDAGIMTIPAAMGGLARGFRHPTQVQSGKRLFERMGLSGEAPSMEGKTYYDFTGKPYIMPKGAKGISPAALAGAALEVATPIPGLGLIGGAAKIGGKGLGKLAEIPAKAAKEVGEIIGSRLQKLGTDIQYRVLKPGIAAERKGFDAANVFKYGVEGSPAEVLQKSDEIIKKAAKEMRERIKTGADKGVTIDIPKQIEESLAPIIADKAGSKENMELIRFIAKEADDAVEHAKQISKNGDGKLDLMEAQNFKQLMGDKGAWVDIAKKKNISISPKETETSKTAEIIYRHLNDVIDKEVPEGIKDLNKTISDLMTVRSVAAYRKVIADRQNKFGMSEMLSTLAATHSGPMGLGMYAASKIGGSGKIAGKIYKTGEKMRSSTPPLLNQYPQQKTLKGIVGRISGSAPKAKLSRLLADSMQEE